MQKVWIIVNKERSRLEKLRQEAEGWRVYSSQLPSGRNVMLTCEKGTRKKLP